MSSHDEQRLLLRHPTRRAIAHACRDTARPIGEIAELFGRPDGALRSTVKNLVRWGVLVELEGGARAQRYRLAPEWVAALDDAAASPPGALTPDAHLLVVSAAALPELAQALLDDEMLEVSWAMRFGDATLGMLIAFHGDRGAALADRLFARLHAYGNCWRLTAGAVFNPGELRQYVHTVAGGSRQPVALPAGPS
jgi:hypothetical protein